MHDRIIRLISPPQPQDHLDFKDLNVEGEFFAHISLGLKRKIQNDNGIEDEMILKCLCFHWGSKRRLLEVFYTQLCFKIK